MSRERIEANYKEAVDLMMSAVWLDGNEACMCIMCKEKRQDRVAEKAINIAYPRLPFLPDMLAETRQYMVGKLNKVLNGLRRIRTGNDNWVKSYPNTPYHFCRRCGGVHSHESTYKNNGKYYCSTCFDQLFECADCGDLVETNYRSTRRVPDRQHLTEYVCGKCSKKLIFCSSCGMGEQKKHIKKLAQQRNEIGNISVLHLCRHCYDEGLRTCDQCGKTTHSAVGQYKRSKTFCPVCWEEHQGILNYDYKPLRPRFRKSKKEGKVSQKAFHMGWELEIAPDVSFIPPAAMVHMVKEHVGYNKIYAMQDGSISQAADTEGMELACHPFTWDYYKQEGYKDWDKMCLYLKKHGWTGNYPGLGIHIHTTKAAWGTHQIYKLLKFVYNNQSFVQRIAGRGATNYCNYDSLNDRQQKVIAKNKINQMGESHYDAINLNNGESGRASKTIEFRIFQSRLEPFNFHKNIEFTHACWMFTQEESDMTARSFRKWLFQNKRAYPCLSNYLNIKGA